MNDLNQVINTPRQQREKWVCLNNMIKEYFDRNSDNNVNVNDDGVVANIVHDDNVINVWKVS